MTQYTRLLPLWFVIKSWAPLWMRTSCTTSWVTRHEKPTPLLYQVSGPFHKLFTAHLLLYIGVSRGTIAKFRPETDAFIEISKPYSECPSQSNPHFKVSSPIYSSKMSRWWVDGFHLLILMSRWNPIYSWVWKDGFLPTHQPTHE